MAVIAGASAASRAVERGANVVQLRGTGKPARELVLEVRELTAEVRVPVLVSSRADIALAAGAAGVNLPERDISVADARRLLGAGFLVGRSVHSLAAALQAAGEGADYVLFGPVFATPSHAVSPTGVGELNRVAEALTVPVVAIGGIDVQRARECLAAGAAGYAGIRMFR